jgi:hypothetical protein
VLSGTRSLSCPGSAAVPSSIGPVLILNFVTVLWGSQHSLIRPVLGVDEGKGLPVQLLLLCFASAALNFLPLAPPLPCSEARSRPSQQTQKQRQTWLDGDGMAGSLARGGARSVARGRTGFLACVLSSQLSRIDLSQRFFVAWRPLGRAQPDGGSARSFSLVVRVRGTRSACQTPSAVTGAGCSRRGQCHARSHP